LVWDYPESKYEDFCYNLNEIDKIINNRCNNKAIDIYNETHFKKTFFRPLRRIEFETFYRAWEQINLDIFKDLFKQHPIWHIEHRHDSWYICYNCSLKKLKFFKIKDAITTYQEIAMFLGGLAVPDKPIPVPSDKDMVSIKGFDKFSFRKDPKK
jgi:hypothetical protein